MSAGVGDPLRVLLDWIDIPSVSGAEGDYGDALARHLERAGLSVERQELAPGRFNVLARAGRPDVVFCTHLDTVPPWFGPSEDARFVYGRGSCDAKGPALAMIEAARRLVDGGEDRIGMLFTVGEEVDGAGAIAANERLAEPWAPRFTIVGEPTDNRFVRGHKGILRAELHAHGVAGHSSQPGGPSAVHELVRTLDRMLSRSWGSHEVFGEGSLNVGRIEGGVAANVIADRARAVLLLRTVESCDAVERRLREALSEHVQLAIDKSYDPVDFLVPDGGTGPVVAFGTDAPFLSRWGKRLLYGPGSIRDAHTDHERLERASFQVAVADYERTVRELLTI